MRQITLTALYMISMTLYGQKPYCPPIVELATAPTSYSFTSTSPKKTYVKEECKAKHPKYTGNLRFYDNQEPFTETVKEVRITAILDGCYNLLEVVKIDTILTGQSVHSASTYGGYWTVRLEYLQTPAKHRPKGFNVSLLPDGNWATHSGKYTSKAQASKALQALMQEYPAWCRMYAYHLPPTSSQGVYE
ncbi:hypothetical protein UFOVP1492_135 [uncultured Caudovirales phage]|uniref:Uncharacterized protein n=1 Tax=uncultured Caudovirales phage TaxID=2100421 RepID=A0A6J5RI93_9CAUD|nr:hypothetical protein UFOVP1127_135 [uncultured Caudovirales phage]CAB4193418.1 hypothetical protein UFOVP1242_75 [uncultured Caudovirales phage]CAB4217939.1 hypothetical protein UFOVP1492_135 [uncultured Caudovirales phage]CAB5231170.1 hypothetical protein UFOVP1580_28 [uncultured Caudovirales phage]